MDLHQIFRTHMRTWTFREIMIFILLTVGVGIVLVFSAKYYKLQKTQVIALFVCISYLEIVFASTVFMREASIRQYRLVPMWSWYEAIKTNDIVLIQGNVLNMILFVPIGFLLPFIHNHAILLRNALKKGILVSMFIEISQLALMRGLFEWDDMIHNGLGCMLGCFIGNFIWKALQNRKNKNEMIEWENR